jgi:S1-C subfamily serine protease
LAQLRQEQPTGKRKRFLDALAKANESLVAVDDLRKRVIYSLGDKTPKGGVVIVGLEPMGAAGRAGLHLGDILLGLGGRNLRDIADFSARAEALAAGTGRKKAPDGSVSIYYLRYGLGHEALMPRGKMGCEVVRLPRRFLENR